MNWLVIASGLISLAVAILRFLSDKDTSEAAVAKELLKDAQATNDKLVKAIAARRAAADAVARGGLRDNDGFRRD